MLNLTRGDRLPSVATCQLLLNAHREESDAIKVDGIFGQQTQNAVAAFQAQRKLTVSRKVDSATWSALSSDQGLRIHDHVDIFDPALRESARVLQNAGARPVLAGGMSNGVAALRTEIMSTGVSDGRLVMLRLHGHGNKGKQALSYGTVPHVYYDAVRRQAVPDLHHLPPASSMPASEMLVAQQAALYSQISAASLAVPSIASELSLLIPLFHPAACIEFHGCQVGGGSTGVGMLRQVAERLGIPAVAARNKQTTGNAIRYHGAVEMQFPESKTLQEWAKGLAAPEQCV